MQHLKNVVSAKNVIPAKVGIHFFFILYFCISCVPTVDIFSELTDENVEDRFYIKFDVDHYTNQGVAVPLYELSSDDSIGLIDCGVDKGDPSIEDMYCILDLNEADIGVLGQAEEGIPIQYNVPRGMCRYTTFMAPWHWNQRSGIGPPELCKYTPENNNPSGTGSSSEEGSCYKLPTSEDSCPNTKPPGTNCATGWNTIEDESDLSKEYCSSTTNIPYDPTTDENSPFANCCFGKYKVTEAGGDDNSNDIAEWGGNIQDCIGGPIRSSDWEAYLPLDGYGEIPVPIVTSSWTRGLRRTFTVGPVIENAIMVTSVPTATYFDGIEDLIFTDQFACPNCPDIFFPDVSRPSDIFLTPRFSSERISLRGYPYFTLECLGTNFESLHRIHLIIREWNTKEEFISFEDSDGRSGDPDIDGEEGGDCPYYEADEKLLGRTNCNDFLDLDDYGTYPYINYNSGGGQ